MTLPQEIIRKKRDGLALEAAEIEDFIAGLTDGRITDYDGLLERQRKCAVHDRAGRRGHQSSTDDSDALSTSADRSDVGKLLAQLGHSGRHFADQGGRA